MKALSLLFLSAYILSWAQALADPISKRNNNSTEGETKPGLAIIANILTIIAAIAQVVAIAVRLPQQARAIVG